MASITVKHLLDGISEILQDTDTDQTKRLWPESYLVDAYNIEIRNLAAKSPDACTVTEAVKMASGIRQTIPAKGIALISVLMNMGTDGATPGEALNRADLGVIPLYDRDWASADDDNVILNFMPDPGNPRAFYTYPPADGTSYVLEEYSVVPDQIVYDLGGDWELALVGVNEKYLGQLEEKIIARCYKKDSDIPGNLQRESGALQQAQQGG